MNILFFSLGIVIGWAGCLFAPRRKDVSPKIDKYEKYKNQDGLYSRKAMRG